MSLSEQASAQRFAEFAAGLAGTIGHRVRGRHLKEYCTGLLLPGERKSIEPIAAKIAPDQACAAHQSLLHFVNEADWPDAAHLDAWVRGLPLTVPSHAAFVDASAFGTASSTRNVRVLWSATGAM